MEECEVESSFTCGLVKSDFDSRSCLRWVSKEDTAKEVLKRHWDAVLGFESQARVRREAENEDREIFGVPVGFVEQLARKVDLDGLHMVVEEAQWMGETKDKKK